MYALGQTQHTTGVQNIRTLCMIQLLLGNMGICGGGVNAMRGEPNVQGSTDFAILSHILPGYLNAPRLPSRHWKIIFRTIPLKPPTPGRPTGGRTIPKYTVSLLKAWYGDKATKDNDFGYAWVPKLDDGQDCSILNMIDNMFEKKIKGFMVIAQNPACSLPNSNKVRQAMTNLDWVVHVNIFDNETASFWKGPGMNPKKIKTEVFLLPAAASVEKEGSQTNSGRWVQWKYAGSPGPGGCHLHRRYRPPARSPN